MPELRRSRRTRLALSLAAAGGMVLTLSAAPSTAAPAEPSVSATPHAVEPIQPVVWPSFTGALHVGKTLTADDGAWSIAGVTTTRQWLRDGDPIVGATGRSYTLTFNDLDRYISVEVTARRTGFADGVAASDGGWVQERVTIANVAPPRIFGAVRVGETVTTDGGDWAPYHDELAYQWLRAGAPIAGATDSSYQIGQADFGKTLAVRVTASAFAAVNTATSTSAPQIVAQGNTPVATVAPTLSGAPQVGATLTVNRGTWAPANTTTEVQWFRGLTEIAGATGSTHVATLDDLGHDLTARVKASSVSLTGWTIVHTAPLRIVDGPAPTVTTMPSVQGTAAVGATVTAFDGIWSPAGVTLTRQWLRDGLAIAGQTGPTYTLATADLGRRVSVRVTATMAGRADGTSTSAPVTVGARQAVVNLTAPRVIGSARWGTLLTAAPGTWNPAPTSLSYQWLRDGVPIAGATGATHRVTDADIRRRVSVRVQASQTDRTPGTATSASVLALPTTTKLRVKAPKQVIDGSRATVRVTLKLNAARAANGTVKIFDDGRRVARTRVPATTGKVRLMIDTSRLRGTGWHELRVAYSGTPRSEAATVWVEIKVRKR